MQIVEYTNSKILIVLYLVLFFFFVETSSAVTKQIQDEQKIEESSVSISIYDVYFKSLNIFFNYEGLKFENSKISSLNSYSRNENMLFTYVFVTGIPNLDILNDVAWGNKYQLIKNKWSSFNSYREIGVEEGELENKNNLEYLLHNENNYIIAFALIVTIFLLKKRKKFR